MFALVSNARLAELIHDTTIEVASLVPGTKEHMEANMELIMLIRERRMRKMLNATKEPLDFD